MKVTITGKGEGFVTARYEAESPIEAMMLSVCSLESTEGPLEIKSETSTDWGKTPPTKTQLVRLLFPAFYIKAMSMVQGVGR